MTPTEAAALLTVAAAFDNRKPDADAAKAWSVALDGIRFEDARDAIVAHYRASSEWLMPAKVIAEVKRIRAKRIVDHPPLTPPAELGVAETNAWRRRMNWRIGNGEEIADDARGELHERHLPELRALMPSPDAPVVEPAPDEPTVAERVAALVHPDVALVRQYRGNASPIDHGRVRAAMHRFRPGQPLGWVIA